MQTDENELIRLSLRRDADAYGQLVDRYKNALYRHCFAVVRDEDMAEDIAQETFIAAYYKLHQFDSSKRFSTWIFKIATNNALNALKKGARTFALDDETVARLVSTHSTPLEDAENTELLTAVVALQPNYRAVIHLYYFEGMRYEEIAQVMSAPVGSVKAWMNRAKSQLRKEMT